MKKVRSVGVLVLGVMLTSCNKVETTQPKRADIIDAVFASGNVISAHEYKVTANTEGYLVGSFVELGDRVDASMPLFQLSNQVQSEQLSNAEILYKDAVKNASPNAPQRVQLELQLEQSKSQLSSDKRNYERYKRLYETNAVSQVELDQKKLQYENALRNVEINEKALDDLINSLELNVENAKTQLIIQKENNADYYLISKIDGEVLQIYKEEGDLVRRGEVVAIVGGEKSLCKLYVSEEDINEIKLNQLVVLNLNTDRKRTYEGIISKIYPSFDDIVQSFIVESSFLEQPELLFHNTQLQANIIIDDRANTLVIPSTYLYDGDSVKLKNGAIKPVQVGIRNDQWVEIINGVEQGDILQKPSSL